MSSKKIIAVTGATGLQGGSVAKYLLEDATFAVRAITRNPDSAAGKALSAKGAEVVKGDFEDPQSIIAALVGAYGVFGLTNYWEGMDGEHERVQARALVDGAKAAGVKHFIWSTLDHTPYRAAHWESKADIDDYLKKTGLPRTSFYTSYYFENYTHQLPLLKNDDGTFTFPLDLTPDVPIAVYSVDQTGAWVLLAFKNPEEWIGKDMRIASEFISAREMVKSISDLSGKTVHLPEITIDLTPPDPENLAYQTNLQANFKVLMANNKPPFRDPEFSRKLYPEIKTWHTWVKENINEIVA